MAEVKFKLEEGLIGSIAKGIGATLLAPVLGGNANAKGMINNYIEKSKKKKLYTFEKEVNQLTKNSINGILGLVKLVKVLGQKGFDKEELNESELEVVYGVIRDIIESKQKEYVSEVKRAIDHEHAPPTDYFNERQITNNVKSSLEKKVAPLYKKDREEYYRLNQWVEKGMKMSGTTLPKQIYLALDNLEEIWAQLELKRANKE